MKMWSGRFDQGPDADFEQWQRSFPFDRGLLPYEVAASQAHASALAKAGVLVAEELAATLFALDQIGREGVPDADDPAIEDVHHYVETRLVELIGEIGYKLHTGRSRNEQIATDLRLYVREQIDETSRLLAEFASAFVNQAEAAGDNAMPAYTHLQRAEPVLVAHWLLAYVEMFLRDIDRLSDCRKRLNVCPLGSGAVAGTILPLDCETIAAQLAFDSPTANSMDATSDRDFAIEFVQALSFVALHLSRWAEEFILFSTTEFGFVKLPEQYSTGSSAMPQKKNPDALELVRGKAGKVFAEATALFIGVKGLPLAYNKDLQETQQPVLSAAQQVSGMVRVATGFMGAVEFNYDRMQ
ncbi:MAG: argininosuccinate lyase, partial [Candidatus Korobacteraceae bacterium]